MLDAALDAEARAWDNDDRVGRLWARDASLWTGADESRWLGWLDLVTDPPESRALAELVSQIHADGITDLLLLGMGGSSLAAEVLSRVLPAAAGAPTLHVLDSTDPAQVGRIAAGLDLSRTACMVSSKSGTTLEPTLLTEYFIDRIAQVVGADRVGSRFLAITDPGSALEAFARERQFRAVWPGVPSVGGRFSALSNFGVVPSALCGLDVAFLFDRARSMADRCGAGVAAGQNPGVRLGLVLGLAAAAGRDKVTLLLSPAIAPLGGWLEQLLAESTGKNGLGVIPIVDESLGAPGDYGADRLFVVMRLAGESDPTSGALDDLVVAAHPVVELGLDDGYDVGAEFVRWEIATAVCGAVMGVNPFDQPDVEASKVAARELATAYERDGEFPSEAPVASDDGLALYMDADMSTRLREVAGPNVGVGELLAAPVGRLGEGDYLALLAYLDMTPEHAAVLQRMRHAVRASHGVATSLGFGPRFLHSTGQAFKGGPDTGVFVQITADDPSDLPIPGRGYTFGAVKTAQALGDFRVLVARGRRAVRVHLGHDVVGGLDRLEYLVSGMPR
ncbi:MAG TPA: transaldolase [Acidobacteria bacterium]|nr:transaldolase [Acidobacteriota bacterium]